MHECTPNHSLTGRVKSLGCTCKSNVEKQTISEYMRSKRQGSADIALPTETDHLDKKNVLVLSKMVIRTDGYRLRVNDQNVCMGERISAVKLVKFCFYAKFDLKTEDVVRQHVNDLSQTLFDPPH